MKRTLILILFLLMSSASFGIVTDLGIDPLTQASGSRPLGMGGAFVAVSDDMNALFYNPAGISKVRGFVGTARAMKDFSLGVAYDTQAGGFGLGLVSNLHESLVSITPETNYEDSMVIFSYGINFGELSLGFTAKSLLAQKLTIHNKTDIGSTGGSDIDAGILWNPRKWVSLGVVAHNIQQNKFTIESSEESMPGVTTTGLAFKLLGTDAIYDNDTYDLLLAYDYSGGIFAKEWLYGSSYGAEFTLWKWLFIRGGGGSRSFNGEDRSYASAGIGVKNGDLSFDLASAKDPYTDSQLTYLSVMYFPPKATAFKFVQPVFAAPEVKREQLIINYPPGDVITYDDRTSIEGEANPRSQVMINGAQAYVDDDWKLFVVQPLNPGKNLIVIESTLNGEKKRIEKRVFRKAKVVIAEEANLSKKYAVEVQKREEELKKKEAEVLAAKKKGIDVTEREKAIALERNAIENKKQAITQEKLKLDERKGKVENLVNLGVIEVLPQKSFQIETPIKRGEMITWLVKAAGLPIPILTGPVCVDVPQDNPDAPYIKAAMDAGLIRLPADNRFRPNDPVTDSEGQAFFKAFGVLK